MKVRLFCESIQEEVDCVNIDAIEVQLSNGKSVKLTETALLKVLEQLDVRADLHDWLMVKEAER
ncbi:MAG: hypothetical protein R3A44_19670 [Caldilineaceae bacterium]